MTPHPFFFFFANTIILSNSIGIFFRKFIWLLKWKWFVVSSACLNLDGWCFGNVFVGATGTTSLWIKIKIHYDTVFEKLAQEASRLVSWSCPLDLSLSHLVSPLVLLKSHTQIVEMARGPRLEKIMDFRLAKMAAQGTWGIPKIENRRRWHNIDSGPHQ